MDEWLTRRFEENRSHLRSVAYRMLGSPAEADDALQEAWIRLSRTEAGEIQNLGGWLTTVVARVCLDMLRSRKSRREEPLAEGLVTGQDPERDALLADSVGSALLVVLDTLAPAERVAFVLHDLFGMPFDDVAPIVGRSPAATRQLASRGRRRVRGGGPPELDRARQAELVAAFLAAARHGDFDGLVAKLAPDVEFRADDTAIRVAAANKWGGGPELPRVASGERAVAEIFKGRAGGATPVLIDGAPGAVWLQGGKPRAVFAFTTENDQIVAVELFMDPERIARFTIEI